MRDLKTSLNFSSIIESVREIDRNFLFNDTHAIRLVIQDEEIDSDKDSSSLNEPSSTTRSEHLTESTLGESLILNKSKYLIRSLLLVCNFSESSKWKLLYRATRDGFCSEFFHQHCDYIPDTLVIVKAKNGCVFGGFTSLPWDRHTGSKYGKPKSAFLFSLVNRENRPVRFDYTGRGRSIYCSTGYGPTFGGDLPDLFIASNANKNRRSYSNLGSSYEYRVGNSKKSYISSKNMPNFDVHFLTGSFHFQVAEIEVFSLV